MFPRRVKLLWDGWPVRQSDLNIICDLFILSYPKEKVLKNCLYTQSELRDGIIKEVNAIPRHNYNGMIHIFK